MDGQTDGWPDRQSGPTTRTALARATQVIKKQVSTTRKYQHRSTNGTVIKNSEYDQEIPQSQTADNPVAPRGRAAQPSWDTRKTN